MFNRILVISDNLVISERFKQITDSPLYSAFNWFFSTSPFSVKSEFENKLKCKVLAYDLTNETTIELLINSYDLIFSLHCKQVFPSRLVKAVKCINIHPGYNPVNRGWYSHVFAIINNLPAGATIHEMDEKIDHGKIIDRSIVQQEIYDTSETLYEKIIAKEIELTEKNLQNILNNHTTSFEPENEGNLFLKKDFEALLKLDLNKTMTGLQFINQLRALTHGENRNAYFIDPKTGKKVFITISLEADDA